MIPFYSKLPLKIWACALRKPFCILFCIYKIFVISKHGRILKITVPCSLLFAYSAGKAPCGDILSCPSPRVLL